MLERSSSARPRWVNSEAATRMVRSLARHETLMRWSERQAAPPEALGRAFHQTSRQWRLDRKVLHRSAGLPHGTALLASGPRPAWSAAAGCTTGGRSSWVLSAQWLAT